MQAMKDRPPQPKKDSGTTGNRYESMIGHRVRVHHPEGNVRVIQAILNPLSIRPCDSGITAQDRLTGSAHLCYAASFRGRHARWH